MRFRRFGKTGKKISALGSGAMRLPTRGKESDVDEAAAIEVIRHAIDLGVNYIDTAYPYHGGNGEAIVGRALEDGYREKVYVATKSPIWQVQTSDDFSRILDEQLARLQVDHIDFYLLHCVQARFWPKMQELRAFDWAERAQADGRIGEFGFSFHDSFEVFREIVDAYDWSFCQIQYNFVNEDVQAGTKGLNYAAAKGLGVIVMEPLFGGSLANPPEGVREIWQAAGRRPAEVALRWLWDKEEVSFVLSGMNRIEQVDENVATAEYSGVGQFSEEERQLVGRIREKYKELSSIPCTKCGYCAPCPQGVNIPLNFELYNSATLFKGNSATLCRNLYRGLPASEQAKSCQACGACEERCPQGIEIGRLMAEVERQFQ